METKKKYTVPHIEIIFLDNEISLALASSPPIPASEGFNFKQNTPFKEEVDLV